MATWIANIYLRHPYVCAQGAAFIADATGGRFILGLGVSHQPVNRALGIDMPAPQAALRRYVTAVRSWLRGEGPVTRCREQLEAFRTAGVAMPILMPPMGVEAARTVIQAFQR